MFARSQLIKLILVSLALWISAMLYIRLFPSWTLDPVMGGLSFLTTFLLAWLSIILIRKVAGLKTEQLIAGVGVVGTVAMMIDGAVLHWAPTIYGASETVVRLGAAWLLWGYGVSLGIALFMSGSISRSAR
ncbi:MAG: DUF5367 family protein [Acetobacter sp.]